MQASERVRTDLAVVCWPPRTISTVDCSEIRKKVHQLNCAAYLHFHPLKRGELTRTPANILSHHDPVSKPYPLPLSRPTPTPPSSLPSRLPRRRITSPCPRPPPAPCTLAGLHQEASPPAVGVHQAGLDGGRVCQDPACSACLFCLF